MAPTNEKIAACIKEKGNWGRLDPVHRFDHKEFQSDVVKKEIAFASPKVLSLLENIQALDKKDMEEHGHLFKHFIYSDIKSAYGAKLIASALSAAGFQHAYELKKTSRGMSFTLNTERMQKKSSKVFATLTSVAFFEKPIGVNFRKDLLKEFNRRPENSYGERIRIIILDSGFREGVDLFDVKYVHLFETIATKSDEKQAIGRGTRYCGQKGLHFDPVAGWPLHVYRYETVLTPEIQSYLLQNDKTLAPADSFYQLFLRFSNLDPKKLTFANELETVAIGSAVDKDLTKEIHEFKIPGMQKGGGKFQQLQKKILDTYGHLTWSKIEVKNMCVPSGGATLLPFTPTQDFVRSYFTPAYENPGMLLWHSVGTGKTCTAIATASSTFEPQDYTILYVTRYTLKGDVWKNMFDQACSVLIQDMLRKGKTLPEAHAARLRLLSKGWFEPMSYRQLSNLLAGKNQLSKVLEERNGKKDILHKTLIIIDEAHKLFAADVEGQEKADMDVVRKALLHSNRVSGKDGVKLLLMTATPYTSDPMDLMRLLNLCRPADKQLPETFEEFSKEYLNENGQFTEESKIKFYDELAGYISYLNREKDIRSFSYPVVHEVSVPMSNYNFIEDVQHLRDVEVHLNRSSQDLVNNKGMIHQDAAKMNKDFEEQVKETLKPHYENHQACIGNVKHKMSKRIMEVNKNYRENLQQCDTIVKKHKEAIRKGYDEVIKKLKEEARAESKRKGITKEEKQAIKDTLQRKIELYKEDRVYDIEQSAFSGNVLACREAAQKVYADELMEAKNPLPKEETCTEMLNAIKTLQTSLQEENKKRVERFVEERQARLKVDEEQLQRLKKNHKDLHQRTYEKINKDVSQRKGLEKCLEGKVKPAYQLLLRGDSLMDEEAVEEEVIEEGKDNVFLIVGHGSEKVVNFQQRKIIPKDKVLVVFPVCARPNFMDSGCTMMSLFNNPEYAPILRNPIKYRRKISKLLERPLRIYLPGEYVPNMSTNLFLDFDKGKTVLTKSGVYRLRKIPEIDRTVLSTTKQSLGSTLCSPFIGEINKPMDYTSKVHHQVFKGNVYKPASARGTFNSLRYRNFALSNIMEETGPGVYYYIGCRSSDEHIQPEKYVQILEASEMQQEQRERTKKIEPVLPFLREKGAEEEEPEPPVSERSTKPRPSTKKDEKPEDKKKKTREKVLVNTKEEKERLVVLESEINYLRDTLRSLKDVPEWREELQKMVQTKKVVSLLRMLQLIETLYDKRESAKEEYMVKIEKEGKEKFFTFWVVSVLRIHKQKHTFNARKIGMIHSTMKDDTLKCSATLLKKKILKALESNTPLPLAKISEDATKENFLQLCQQLRIV